MLRNLRAGFFILALIVSVGVALTDEVPLPNTPQSTIARFAWSAAAIAILASFIFLGPTLHRQERPLLDRRTLCRPLSKMSRRLS